MSESKCNCDVGPGRYEGESPITPIVHEWSLNGGGGDSLSFGDGSWAELITDTAEAWSAEDKALAREVRFCDECIAEAEKEFHAAQAVTFGGDSQGFLWSKLWDSREEAQAAYDADLAEMAEQEEAD